MDLLNVLSKEECRQAIQVRLRTGQFHLESMNIVCISDDWIGFLGEHGTLITKVVLQDSTEPKTLNLHFFLKCIPRTVAFHSEYVKSVNVFVKEIGFYSTILPNFKKNRIETDKNWTCDCYFTKHDLLVLEDLSPLGFSIRNKRETLERTYCVVVLETLARMHAASIIFEEKESKKSGRICNIGELYSNLFFESIFSDIVGHSGRDAYYAGIEANLKIIELLPKYGKSSKFYDQIQETFVEFCKQLAVLLKPSNKYRNVVCHGDLWVNNLLFRHEGGNPTEVRFVDFQLIRYAPPALDIVSFLHLVTTREFRDQHWDEMLQIYHTSLDTCLLSHGLNSEELLPWKELYESCKQLKVAGVLQTSSYQQVILMEDKLTAPIYSSSDRFDKFMCRDRSMEVRQSFLEDALYQQRMTEIIDELIGMLLAN